MSFLTQFEKRIISFFNLVLLLGGALTAGLERDVDVSFLLSSCDVSGTMSG